MAFHSSTSGIFSLKNIAMLSTGVLSFAVLLKVYFPLSDFAVSELPSVYSTVISWLRPPYLYLVINGIIISILASSKLQKQRHKSNDVTALSSSSSHVFVQSTDEFVKEVVRESYGEFYHENLRVDQAEVVEEEEGVVEEKVVVKEGGDYDERVVMEEKIKERSDSIEMLWKKIESRKTNKPPASARFGRKKSLKASPEVGKGGGLGVTRPKRHDTLESTWKMITDGRPMPLTRRLKKSDTWDTDDGSPAVPLATTKPMNKSETFDEAKSKVGEENRGRLKREASLSLEELNKRVEAFMNKFNEEMRLQRQQSLDQYKEIMASRAY